jgi:hypothetical protein
MAVAVAAPQGPGARYGRDAAGRLQAVQRVPQVVPGGAVGDEDAAGVRTDVPEAAQAVAGAAPAWPSGTGRAR